MLRGSLHFPILLPYQTKISWEGFLCRKAIWSVMEQDTWLTVLSISCLCQGILSVPSIQVRLLNFLLYATDAFTEQVLKSPFWLFSIVFVWDGFWDCQHTTIWFRPALAGTEVIGWFLQKLWKSQRAYVIFDCWEWLNQNVSLIEAQAFSLRIPRALQAWKQLKAIYKDIREGCLKWLAESWSKGTSEEFLQIMWQKLPEPCLLFRVIGIGSLYRHGSGSIDQWTESVCSEAYSPLHSHTLLGLTNPRTFDAKITTRLTLNSTNKTNGTVKWRACSQVFPLKRAWKLVLRCKVLYLGTCPNAQ